MKVATALRLPKSDLEALDALCKGHSRSEYLRKVLMEYANDRAKMLSLIDHQLENFYATQSAERTMQDNHNPD